MFIKFGVRKYWSDKYIFINSQGKSVGRLRCVQICIFIFVFIYLENPA